MDASIPKIDSYEKYKEQYPAEWPRTLEWEHNPTNYSFCPLYPRGVSDLLMPAAGVFPDVQWLSTGINEHNFWLNRETVRFCDRTYQPPSFFEKLRHGNVADVARTIWWHFLHVALKDPTMIAFTPSWDYGMRDRQVVMKVGKYLTKFYSEVMSPEEIRDIVNRFSNREILYAETADEIEHVYVHGPNSCMSGSVESFDHSDDFDGIHPVRVYGYRYENNEPEFNVAYLKNDNGDITARAIVAVRCKKFVRCYGDDGPILQSYLIAAGYEFVCDMGQYGLRLQKMRTLSGRFIMPYLDGDQGIKDCGEYWEWNSSSYDRQADNSEGRISSDGYHDDDDDDEEEDDRSCCSVCGEACDDDDLRYSEHHVMDICTYCRDNGYEDAYFNCSHDTTPVHNDQLILCESDSAYYLNSPRVLDWHGIVQATNGDWYEKDDDDIFCTVDREYVHIDELDEYIETYGGHAKRDDITNEWLGCFRADGDISWYHPDEPPVDASLKIQFQDDFGTEHTRWEPNPKYFSPGQLWSLKQDEQHDIHDLCDHIQDLGEEWEEETTPDTASLTLETIQAVMVNPALPSEWMFPNLRGNNYKTIIFDEVIAVQGA